MYGWQAGGWNPTGMLSCDGNGQSMKIIIMILKTSSNVFSYLQVVPKVCGYKRVFNQNTFLDLHLIKRRRQLSRTALVSIFLKKKEANIFEGIHSSQNSFISQNWQTLRDITQILFISLFTNMMVTNKVSCLCIQNPVFFGLRSHCRQV